MVETCNNIASFYRKSAHKRKHSDSREAPQAPQGQRTISRQPPSQQLEPPKPRDQGDAAARHVLRAERAIEDNIFEGLDGHSMDDDQVVDDNQLILDGKQTIEDDQAMGHILDDDFAGQLVQLDKFIQLSRGMFPNLIEDKFQGGQDGE